MDDQRALRRIQSAPDAVVRQEYRKEDGKKHLDHVVWSSRILGMEIRVDIPRLNPKTAEVAEDVVDVKPVDTKSTGTTRGKHERKE
ncbi:MAG: hypothetical protein A2Y38_20105 [Spirochaetes bacterium GWB1_59_5]|nr:MAG: hypothetical protein A2Y38_20105 [Spirochaetes bacterium GWB1_59_5]